MPHLHTLVIPPSPPFDDEDVTVYDAAILSRFASSPLETIDLCNSAVASDVVLSLLTVHGFPHLRDFELWLRPDDDGADALKRLCKVRGIKARAYSKDIEGDPDFASVSDSGLSIETATDEVAAVVT